MNIFIAGIGGVFMAGVAQLAKASGHAVRGCDGDVYPPMSTLLAAENIAVAGGYSPEHLGDAPGLVLIGNALSRGNAVVESVLARGLPYQSGPQWLRDNVLAQRRVLAVAGTHGKTTTAAILAWILQSAGQSPGYLIGGKPGNFARSASLGDGACFVIEADEYDTAFFDKRSKFLHYRPHLAILNNLEFDHADIFDNVEQIQKQFHHLMRIVPPNGAVVVNADDQRLAEVIEMGCWSPLTRFSTAATARAEVEWRAVPRAADCSSFEVLRYGKPAARVNWRCMGRHNMANALAALAAADLVGVPVAAAAASLARYVGVDRRLQLLHQCAAISVYDDFAHHPSAIAATIAALRARHAGSRVFAVVELRSNTMRMGDGDGGHGATLAAALRSADCAIISAPGDAFSALNQALDSAPREAILRLEDADEIVAALQSRHAKRRGNDVIVTMSDGGFGGLAGKIAAAVVDW